MRTRTILALAALHVMAGCGCTSPERMLPDRAGLGVTVDAEDGAAKFYQGTLFWSLR